MEIKPCPFCGAKPEFPEPHEVFGTQYEFGCTDCGIPYSSIQIIDCFDYPRDAVHNSWDEKRHRYGDEFIGVARNEAIEAWNQRAQ